ncbi:cation-translocating P-type ATPase [Actinomycetospora sp. TBRC 11914]|uniref:cation-translocating P-type ATPase n=1 Tax=Actinomycetospora sp. TBRC 11914 TaxID=2729387 RepID=UPI00145DB1B9|nr:cation-translocating P-type ATPase [Actinomycetospora sp. TBRC 11914]NMO92363.1 HAD-IC family P-type ATPase [Actinomycetospora sp. TBRC 11914]
MRPDDETLRPRRSLLGRIVDPFGLGRAALDALDPARHRGRRVWRGDGRVHIGVPATARESGAELLRAIEKALAAHPAVDWATVNAALGVVVVALADGEGGDPATGPDEVTDDLVDLVELLEEQEEQTEAGLLNPTGAHASTPVARAVTAFAADLAGLGFAGVGSVLRRTPLPVEYASAASFFDHQPRLRAVVERALGRQRADVFLALANAAGQGLGQGSTGLLVDAAYRAMQIAETRAAEDAFARAEPRMMSTPEQVVSEVEDGLPAARPVPFPDGPVERHGDYVGAAALGGFGLTAALGGPRRAIGVALSTLPKAGRMGREGFATTFGRVLSKRGAVIVEPTVLRRMDRIDTVVLDASALTTGALMLGDLVLVEGGQEADERGLTAPDGSEVGVESLTPLVHELFDPSAATRPAEHETGWLLAPLAAGREDEPGVADAVDTVRTDGATVVLGLSSGDELVAVVGALPEPAAAAEALGAAARRAGLALVVGTDAATSVPAPRRPEPVVEGAPDEDAEEGDAGDAVALPGADSSVPATRRTVDREVPGGEGLAAAVRMLQAEGAGVLVVSRERGALAAADLGIGVARGDGTPAWGAHVLVGDDLATAALLIDGVKVARATSGRSVALARAGTALGAAMATAGTAPRGPSLAGLAVNGAAGVALGAGAWSASELGRKTLVPGVARTPWHVMPAETVLTRLDTTERGLSGAEAVRRTREDPAADAEEAPSLGRAFLDELNNPLTPVLAGGAVLSAAIGAVADAAIVVGVTAASALIGGVQRVWTDRAVAGLLERSSTRARVLRDGVPTTVTADDVVVGDVVELGPDDVVPADCRVLRADGLELDESSLTGESLPVPKAPAPVIARSVAERRSMLYEGTTVAAGRGRAVVVATGSSTEVGRSTAAARANAPVAGVDTRLSGITKVTTPLALASAGAVVGAGAIRGLPMQQNLHSGVGLAVASVPEGLPFIVSAAQLASARRLSAEGALVRNPKTIEAVGRVDVLCFDKTGTLTEGKLALSAISDGVKLRPTDRLRKRQRRVLAAALRATPRPKAGERLAHLTDRAVVFGAQSFDVDPEHKRPGWWPLASLDFDPSRGYHATLGEAREEGETQRVLSIKGAPEVVIARCTDWAGTPLDDEARQRLVEHTELLAGQGMRVLAVAERSEPWTGPEDRYADADPALEVTDDDVAELSFVGFVGFTDPVRAGSQATVRDLRDAGVQVVMITGDHPSTAEAVADELDVLGEGGTVITGQEMDELDDDALDAVLPKVRVVARGTPAHKVRAVQAFQRLGRTVAMTGDGANDAPAIRLADVGIALGRRGTPAARAAADLVVTDDRLETILAALVEGRAMWASVREALGVLVGGNLGEIGFTVLGASTTGTSPLTARQLLLVNLLTDLAPSLALAVRAPAPSDARSLLAEGPEASLGEALNREITLRAVATAGGASLAWAQARATPYGGPARARTVALAALVGTQLGQTVVAGGYRSPLVVGASAISAGALFGVIQTPGVSQFFGCTPLGPIAWGQAAGSAAAATVGSVIGPELVRRYGGVVAPEGSAVADLLDRLGEVRDDAARRYLELQEKVTAALTG